MLVVALGDQFRDGQQGALVRGLGELGDDLASLVREGLRPLLDALDAAVLFEQRQDAGEWHFIIVALIEDFFYQPALGGRSTLQRINQGQGHLAFAKIVAHGLGEL